MANPRCIVCNNKVRGPIIDAALANGVSARAIAAEQTMTGWEIADTTIIRHRGHYIPPTKTLAPTRQGRDLAIAVRDITLDAVEDGRLTIDGDNWKNVMPGLAAQKHIDAKESRTDDRKTAVAIAAILSGNSAAGFLAPLENVVQIEDGLTLEGEYEEVLDG